MKSVIHKNAITTTTLLIPPFLIQPVPLCLHSKREEDSQEEEDPTHDSQANEVVHQEAEAAVEESLMVSTDQHRSERMTVLLQLKSLRR